MQVTVKITELTAFTTTELAAIESFFSGVGAVALAIIAFYGVYRWKGQATYKREKLEPIIEEHKELKARIDPV